MKAISLWQPWASAIALGSKQIETRHWSTNHRGLIAIHAAKRLVKCEFVDYGSEVARLVTVRPTESFTFSEVDTIRHVHPEPQTVFTFEGWTEREMGDFSPGRFGWVLQDVLMLPNPVPCVGRQALFNLPLDVVQRVCHELEHIHDEQIAKLRKWAEQCEERA